MTSLPGHAVPEPLSPAVKRTILACVILLHAGGAWALARVEPARLIVGDVAPMEVRMVAPEGPAQPEIETAEPPPPVDLTPPPPDLATIVEPPLPDLPPPEFPVAKIDIPPPPEMPEPVIPPPVPKPKPPEPRPVQKAAPRPAAPTAPVDSQPQQTAATASTAPRTVQVSQLGWLVAPTPVYPSRSRRAGEQGTVMVRAFVDIAGRPSQVSLQASSGHAALDEAAVSAVRAAQFRAYAEGGRAQPVWVHVPIKFTLQ
jgi:protein TonB